MPLKELEEREKQKTGIKNLRIKFNKVFGYYFEVTNSYKDLVPEYFIRKQTLANSERYTTEELDNLAGSILGSEDKLYALEYETYVALRDKIAGEILRVQNTARQIALLDCLCSLSYVATRPSAYETERMKQYAEEFPYCLVARDQLEYGYAELSTYNQAEVQKAIDDAISYVMTDQQDVETALAAAQQTADGILQAYR